MSQPAASKTIKELEQILGRGLFDRSSRRLTLTKAGQVFQQHIGAGLIELGRAQDLVKGVPHKKTRVSVGVLPTAATRLAPHAALSFRTKFPNCLLRISTGPNWLLMSQLREGALDLVVGRMATAKVMEGLSFRQLYSERIEAITRPGHPLVQADTPNAHFADYPLVLPPPGAVIAPVVDAFLSRNGIPPDSHAFETVSLAVGRKLVQESDAIWLISRGVVASELTGGTLSALPIDEELLGGPVGISMREDGKTTVEQSGLIADLETAAQQMQV